MLNNIYVNRELIKNDIENPIEHFNKMLEDFENKIKPVGSPYDEIKALTTFRMLKGFKDVHLNEYKQLIITESKDLPKHVTLSEILKLKKETAVILAVEFDFTSIFRKQNEISEKDFQEINEFIETLINAINEIDISKNIKDEIVEELNKIKAKLSKETKKLQVVNSELLSWTDKLFFMDIQSETKKVIIELGTKVFNKIRFSIINCIPEVKEMKIDINAKLSLDWKKTKDTDEEVIDVEVEEKNQLEKEIE